MIEALQPTVLQIPVRASRHGPLADYFQQTGPVLVREAPKKWAFLEQSNAELVILHNWGFWPIIISFTEQSWLYSDAAVDQDIYVRQVSNEDYTRLLLSLMKNERNISISPRQGSWKVGFWSAPKAFSGPPLVGFWLNFDAADNLEHCWSLPLKRY